MSRSTAITSAVVLTAAEGADRVASRIHRRDRRGGVPGRTQAGNHFRCESCSGNTFVIERSFFRQEVRTEVLQCECDPPNPDGGGVREVVESWRCSTRQEIGLDHQVRSDDAEEDADPDGEEVAVVEVSCADCVANAGDDMDWQLEDCSPVDLDDGEEDAHVVCQACGHEIEFGWSDGGRKIWPCEALDFDPAACVPDGRLGQPRVVRGARGEHAGGGALPLESGSSVVPQ